MDFQSDEIYTIEEVNEGETSDQVHQSFPMESRKKRRSVVVTEQVPAFFHYIDGRIRSMGMRRDRDAEQCLTSEEGPKPRSRFWNLWSRVYNPDTKTYFGRTREKLIDAIVWIGAVTFITATIGSVIYLIIQNHQQARANTVQCPNATKCDQ